MVDDVSIIDVVVVVAVVVVVVCVCVIVKFISPFCAINSTALCSFVFWLTWLFVVRVTIR